MNKRKSINQMAFKNLPPDTISSEVFLLLGMALVRVRVRVQVSTWSLSDWIYGFFDGLTFFCDDTKQQSRSVMEKKRKQRQNRFIEVIKTKK